MRRARGWHLVVILVLVVAGIVAVRAQCWHKDGDVPIPPVTAGPVDVVTAYVTALDKHDITTAKALSTPEKVEFTEGADGWYSTTRSIRDLEVREPIPQGPDSGETRAGSREAVYVPVSFDLDQCGGGDGTLPEGDMGWGYLLSRASPTDRWLVTDEGH